MFILKFLDEECYKRDRLIIALSRVFVISVDKKLIWREYMSSKVSIEL
jgi:hypothetical protein